MVSFQNWRVTVNVSAFRSRRRSHLSVTTIRAYSGIIHRPLRTLELLLIVVSSRICDIIRKERGPKQPATLSYAANRRIKGRTLGRTDPRTDPNGRDVAKKFIISRTCTVS